MCIYIQYSSRASLQFNVHTRTCLSEFVIKLLCCYRAIGVHLAQASAARVHLLYARVGRVHFMHTISAQLHLMHMSAARVMRVLSKNIAIAVQLLTLAVLNPLSRISHLSGSHVS